MKELAGAWTSGHDSHSELNTCDEAEEGGRVSEWVSERERERELGEEKEGERGTNKTSWSENFLFSRRKFVTDWDNARAWVCMCARFQCSSQQPRTERKSVCVWDRERERARLCAHARAGLESITYAAAAGYFSSSPSSSFFLCLETIFNEKGKRGRDKDGVSLTFLFLLFIVVVVVVASVVNVGVGEW